MSLSLLHIRWIISDGDRSDSSTGRLLGPFRPTDQLEAALERVGAYYGRS